jgi:hypothetical protein
MPGWVILLGALVVGLVTYAAMAWLVDHAALPVNNDVERARLRIEAIRTGLSVGAATGAALALMLAGRRQWLAERTHQATEHDATERRVTDLYVKAADQLGSDKAPVRLAGLYAMERLAQDNPNQRQAVVSVICAYLRMPYTPPRDQARHHSARRLGVRPGQPRRLEATKTAIDPREELQVRLTAQSVLIAHLALFADTSSAESARLKPDPGLSFWPGMNLDLADASLVDFMLTRGRIAKGIFTGAAFTGTASFDGATFAGDASFDGAAFAGDASFAGAAFDGDASFDRATFTGGTQFDAASFTGDANFNGATFARDANFNEASFARNALFGGVTFTIDANFNGAVFTANVTFDHATFAREALFSGVTFTRDAWFGGATFNANASFDTAIFSANVFFDGAIFNGGARFGRAAFSGDAWFGGVTFADGSRFIGATVHSIDNTTKFWIPGWVVQPDPVDATTGRLVPVAPSPPPPDTSECELATPTD